MVCEMMVVYTSAIITLCYAGYHLGQFKQQVCIFIANIYRALNIFSQGEKRQSYDEDIRVPLIVRDPGIKPNSTTQALALSIDTVTIYTQLCSYLLSVVLQTKAPTFLDLAGWPLPEDMDGQSLKSVLLGDEPAEVNIEYAILIFSNQVNEKIM